ncbi:hypothetical protein FPV67DRAFT_1662964 [Lyophyllum atratum]|nr:hypothetical protein FPV67DRAFT_1662964 [Lyophyllum atratum]
MTVAMQKTGSHHCPSAPDVDTADDRYRPPCLKASTCKPVSKPQNAIPSAVGRQSQDSGREPLAPTQPRALQCDDFRTTYHPSSGRSSCIEPFETFGSKKAASSVPFLDPKPWLPFRSQTEFKFAEIMLDSAMSNKHVDAFIDVICVLRDGDENFVVERHKDLETLWSSATGMHGLSQFEPHIITVNYKGEPRSFTSWQRPFMSWILTCLEDKYLGSVYEWDAIKMEKFDGKKWVQFVTQPFTRKRLWDFQSKIPADGHPIGITLYADKTTLSSFGGQQGYPIMANLINFREELTICITRNVLTEDLAPIGYVVSRCVRAYVNAVMWENLPVHTTETIASGRKAVEHLGACMMELDEVMREDGTFAKSFDFPKLHAHRHVFDLILAMGALCHSTTRLFEGHHIALKKWYQNKINFKDTEEQILRYEFFRLVAYTVSNYVQRNCIDGGLESCGLDPVDKKNSQTAQQFNNIYLGVPQKHTSFFKLEEDNHKDPAFHGFRHRVEESLNNILTRDDSPVQLSGKLSISPNAYISNLKRIGKPTQIIFDAAQASIMLQDMIAFSSTANPTTTLLA